VGGIVAKSKTAKAVCVETLPRIMDISGVFLAVERGLDPMLMTQLTTFVDTVIDDE
jgi:hypothetical protein